MHLISQSVSRSVGQSVSRSVGQSVSRSVSQSVFYQARFYQAPNIILRGAKYRARRQLQYSKKGTN